MLRSDERGVALLVAMFMTLIVSALGAGMMHVARTETLSSQSYTTMAQSRYAAESGLAAAANYLLSSQYQAQAPGTAGDALANYDITVSPVVVAGGAEVLLSSEPGESTYPVAAVVDDFEAATTGTLDVGANGTVTYGARARLVSMREIIDAFSLQPRLLQTWEITGIGRRAGSGSAEVEVTASIERQAVPIFRYAAFAADNGCGALSFAGGATTQSYNSASPLVGGSPAIDNSHGNVGTNGNLEGNGNPTTIYGTLSTPAAGVGNCTAGNVTAATISGWATVEEGLVTLPQPIELPTPAEIVPAPPTTNITFGNGGCPAGAPFCSATPGGARISPPGPASVVSMGNVRVQANGTLRLQPGIYEINSLTLAGNGTIIVEPGPAGPGPVIIKVAGEGQATPIDLAGGGVSNPSFDPTLLQFVYGGTGTVKITGGTDTAALVYAPNASAALSGASTHFYGSIVTNTVTSTGGFNLYWDRRLMATALTVGNPIMSSFTWRTF